jgi:hypothetical protein
MSYIDHGHLLIKIDHIVIYIWILLMLKIVLDLEEILKINIHPEFI